MQKKNKFFIFLLFMIPFHFLPGQNLEIQYFDQENNLIFSETTVSNLSDKKIPPFGGDYIDFVKQIVFTRNQIPKNGTIKIYTEMNSALQKTSEASIKQFLLDKKGNPKYSKEFLDSLPPIQGALVVIHNKTGALQAMTGSIQYHTRGQWNRAVHSRRQISSTVKPFLYALAYEEYDFFPQTVFQDQPVLYFGSDQRPWKPKNYYPYFTGDTTLKAGLVHSINTVSVQLLDKVGIPRARSFLRDIFITEEFGKLLHIPAEPSISLGSIGLSLYELAKGYRIIANLGSDSPVNAIREIRSKDGKLLYKRTDFSPEKRVFSEDTGYLLQDSLASVIQEGTGLEFNSKIQSFLAGKSGSSPADSFFAGFTQSHTIAAWAGYDQPILAKKRKLPLFIIIPLWIHMAKWIIEKEGSTFQLPQHWEYREYCAKNPCGIYPDCLKMKFLIKRNSSEGFQCK